MNIANKITVGRLILSLVIIFILIFFESLGIKFPTYLVNDTLIVNMKYILVAVLFVIASLTDFLDGYIARKNNIVTDFGKMLDAIADKVLVNSLLIILASTGFISPIIPVVIVLRDTVVDVMKMMVGNKGKAVGAIKIAKFKTAFLMIGVTLTLIYNLPFELYNLRIADAFLVIGTILSIISGVQYFNLSKDVIFEEGI